MVFCAEQSIVNVAAKMARSSWMVSRVNNNNHRCFDLLGSIPPAEAEGNYFAAANLDMVACVKLHNPRKPETLRSFDPDYLSLGSWKSPTANMTLRPSATVLQSP